MLSDAWSRVRSALTPASTPDYPTYDIEYLADREYKHLELFVERDDMRLIRCNVCGHYFTPSGIEQALDHVAAHDAHAADDLDALAEEKEVHRI
jgi:hypothetical protein